MLPSDVAGMSPDNVLPSDQPPIDLDALTKSNPASDSIGASFVKSIRAKATREAALGQPFASVNPDGTVTQTPPKNNPESNRATLAAPLGSTDVALEYAGRVAAAIPADVAETIHGDEPYYQLENLASAALGEKQQPIQTKIDSVAKSNPVAATVADISQGVAASAPLLLTGALDLPAIVSKAVALGFSAQMISGVKDLATQYGDEMGKNSEDRDPAKLAQLRSQLIQTGIFAPLAGAHGAGDFVESKIAPKTFLTRQLANQLEAAPVDYSKLSDNVLPSDAAQPDNQTQLQNLNAGLPPDLTKDITGSGVDDVVSQIKANTPDATGIVRTPDGAIDPVQTALNKMRSQAAPPELIESTIAQKAAAAPDKPVTMADLAQMKNELQTALTNPFKASESQTQNPAEEIQALQPAQETATPSAPVASNLPDWAREVMVRAGLDPARPFNDKDLQNPSVRDAIQSDSTLTDEQKFNLLKTGSAKSPLTPTLENATKSVAAPVTSTVRSADELGNERQRGRVRGNPGMTAEEGSNPSLGAAASKFPRRQVSHADAQRPPDLIDHIEGNVGTIDPSLIKEASPDWKPIGAARKIFKKGATPADSALNALGVAHGVTPDMPLDEFGDRINAEATARKGQRQQFYKEERSINAEAKQTQKFHKDIGQQTKDTETLVPDDLNEGDEFALKGAKFKVSKLDFDEDAFSPEQIRELPENESNSAGQQSLFSKGGNDLTRGNPEQTILEAINEKHEAAKPDVSASADERRRNDDVQRQQDQSTFGQLLQKSRNTPGERERELWANAKHDPDFAQTPHGRRLKAVAKKNGTDVVFYKADSFAPAGASRGGKIFVNTNAEDIAQVFEHELAHQQFEKNHPILSKLFDLVDLKSPHAEVFRNNYDHWLASRGMKPLSDAGAREEIIADFVAGRRPHGVDLQHAFTDPRAAMDLVKEYHGAESVGGEKESLTKFSAGEVRPEKERWQDMADKVATAEQNLKSRIADVANVPQGMTKEQAKNDKHIAAATYRNLRDQLLKSPDYAEHLLMQERETHRQLAALAQKAGIETVSPDGLFGYEDKLKAALSPAEMQRVQELDNRWQAARNEIDNLPKKNISAAYNKLYPEETKGTTGKAALDIPSDWMRSRIGEKSPVQDAQDITTATDRVKQTINDLPNHLRDFYRDAQDFTRRARNKISTLDNRDIISASKDAADNKANILSKQAANAILHELNRSFGVALDTHNPIRENALSFVIEAGNPESLRQMRDTIEQSQHYRSTWARKALAAMDYAEKHWDRFEPVAELYGKITDAQVASENAGGIQTLHRSGGYVFHLHDVLENWAHLEMDSATGGAASPFKHIRDFATYADSIAAGLNPRTLNAVDLLQRRIALGQKLINYRNWQDSLMKVIDPMTEQPIVAPVVVRMRADGSRDPTAPSGYKIIDFAGQAMAVHKAYAPIFTALTGESAFRNGGWNYLMKGVTTAKHGMLLFDTYHLGRLAFWNAIARGENMFPNPFAFKKGITLLDNTDADIRRMSETGDLTKEDAEALIAQRKTLNLLINHGLNVGSIGDNIYSDWIQHLPIAGQFNKWLFEKYQRGAMAEVGMLEFQRQKAANPEMSDDVLARNAAKAINVRFGNLNAQSWIKSKTMGDLIRIFGLAPQWNESLIRAELGAVKDAGVAVKSLTLGDKIPQSTEGLSADEISKLKSAAPAVQRRLRMGLLGRAVGTALLGQFIFNQIINYYTRGKPTWENPEEGFPAKISAFIPDYVGHGQGFFLNPMSLPMEMTHLILKGYERTGRLDLAVRDALRSRESAIGRGADVLASGKDSEGNVAHSTSERLLMAARAATPLPISSSALFHAGKQLVTGQPSEQYPGQFQRQAMQTFGIKPDTAPTADQRVRSLAQNWMRNSSDPKIKARAQSFDDNKFHSDYFALDDAIRAGNMAAAKKELDNLLLSKKPQTILNRYAERSQGRFTGSVWNDKDFQSTLTLEQQSQYDKAIAERQRIASVVQDLIRQ